MVHKFKSIIMEDNLLSIATTIFSSPIKPTRSYILQCEESSGIQEILSVITLHGICILYGHYDPKFLSAEQRETCRLYVKSYGFNVLVENGKYKFELLK